MKTLYTDMDIHFSMDNISIRALNIVFERFTRTIPSHSHGNGCYEIHYIPFGCGKLIADGQYYDISPNTLYVTGPHVEHAQTPIQSDPILETLASKLKLSTRQTQRLLMDYYGKSFQQKKTEARMSVAAILLSDKTRSITSIAEDLGYSSIEHFSSAFRNFYQVSPREYRRQL